MTTYHMCMDIEGYLTNHTRARDYKGLFFHDDGRPMTVVEAKQALFAELRSGKRVLPMSDECVGFDYQTGCPGHRDSTEQTDVQQTETA